MSVKISGSPVTQTNSCSSPIISTPEKITLFIELICLTPIFPSESRVNDDGGIKWAWTFFVGINSSAVIPSFTWKLELFISNSIRKVLVFKSAVFET